MAALEENRRNSFITQAVQNVSANGWVSRPPDVALARGKGMFALWEFDL
jgi:hypothetical protein